MKEDAWLVLRFILMALAATGIATVGVFVTVGAQYHHRTDPRVHVVCAAPCSGVILWEGDAARADYADGQWTVCPTSEPCGRSASTVRTSASCVVTPLVEVGP